MFLIAFQLSNDIHLLEIHLCLSIIPSIDLVLNVPFEKQSNHILQSLFYRISRHHRFEFFQLFLSIPIPSLLFTQQPLVSFAEILDDLLNGVILLMQVRPEQVEHLLILLQRNTSTLVYKLALLRQLPLKQRLALSLKPSQFAEIEVVDVEQTVIILKTVQPQLLPYLLYSVLAQSSRTGTAFPIIIFSFHLYLLSPRHLGKHPRGLGCKFLKKSHGRPDQRVQHAVQLVVMKIGQEF